MPGSPKWPLSLRFHHQNPEYTSPIPMHATCPAHLILIDLITRTIFGEQYRSLSSSSCSVIYSSVTSSLLGPNILNTLFSNTLSLGSSLHSHQIVCQFSSTVIRLLSFFFSIIQGGPKIGIQYIVYSYCIPTFSPPCISAR